jgi:hypothetical protein
MSTEYPNALPFDLFEDCINESPKAWLIENVIALDEDSSWFGPPGSLKSALLTDIAVHVASCRGWRGHASDGWSDEDTDPRGVIYFALERAELTRRRLAAYIARDKLPRLPIAVVSEMIDLLNPDCVDIILDTIAQVEQTGCIVRLIIIDTYSKAIAAGDEDKASTQNTAAKHLKLIHEHVNCHIATIGHSGKNIASGERGSNARKAHVDTEVQISDGTAKIIKGNDQALGPIASFEMEEVTVPRKCSDGSDGKPYTVAILAAATPATEARTAASKPPTGKHAQALDALRRAIAARGQDGAVHADYWKEELVNSGRIKADDVNPRATFARIRKGLSQHIIEVDGLVRITQPGQTPQCPAPP